MEQLPTVLFHIFVPPDPGGGGVGGGGGLQSDWHTVAFTPLPVETSVQTDLMQLYNCAGGGGGVGWDGVHAAWHVFRSTPLEEGVHSLPMHSYLLPSDPHV